MASTSSRPAKLLKKNVTKIKKRRNDFLKRRPHRSFRLTRRRDYKRAWSMPGYWSFTNQVRQVLWQNKWLFTKFILLYSTLSFLIVGLLSQENYELLDATVNSLGGDVIAGELSGLVQNIAVFAGIMTGAFTQGLSEVQQAYSALLLLIGWLTVVWLLRHIFASHKNIKLRDGLYNALAPMLSTMLIGFILLLQLLPFAFAMLAYVTAETTGLFEDPPLAVLFWTIDVLLIVLSLYWVSATLIALVVVTLPGMYPIKAIKAANDMIVGRRLRVLYRFVWLALTIVAAWMLVLLPLLALNHIEFIANTPLIPIVVLLLMSKTMVWGSTYTYMLYRKLVSDDTPAA